MAASSACRIFLGLASQHGSAKVPKFIHHSYKSKSRQKKLGSLKSQKLVQDHHVIPREFRSHPAIKKAQFNIDCSLNLIILPTKKGFEILETSRQMHENGHPRYNAYIRSILDKVDLTKSSDCVMEDLLNALSHARGCLLVGKMDNWQ